MYCSSVNFATFTHLHHPLGTTTTTAYHHPTKNHHYTVQVVRVKVRYLRQWVEGKTPPTQVAMGETTTGASGVFVYNAVVFSTLGHQRIYRTILYKEMTFWDHLDLFFPGFAGCLAVSQASKCLGHHNTKKWPFEIILHSLLASYGACWCKQTSGVIWWRYAREESDNNIR